MRLFVALDIPEETRRALSALVAKLRPVCRDARWVRVEGIHLTLKFIGEVPPERADNIRQALASLPPREPFPIQFRGLGFFPNERRPRVFWADVNAGPEFAALAEAVETAFEPLGIAREQRAFSPHLTLARLETPRGIKPLIDAVENAAATDFGEVVAREFHLYQSVLKPGGAEYTQLATFPFARSKPA